MAHYAFLDKNNIVTEVIVGKDENELLDGLTPEEWYGNFRGQKCVRTSYNGNIRKNYAGIGYSYDPVGDVFLPPQPHPKWVLDENYDWQAPVPKPDDGFHYWWDRETENWHKYNLPSNG
jgi:hypothetical protein